MSQFLYAHILKSDLYRYTKDYIIHREVKKLWTLQLFKSNYRQKLAFFPHFSDKSLIIIFLLHRFSFHFRYIIVHPYVTYPVNLNNVACLI